MYQLSSSIRERSIITGNDMMRGDIGVVVGVSLYAGYVVMSTALGLVILAKPDTFQHTCDGWADARPDFKVHLLQPGDSITLTVSK